MDAKNQKTFDDLPTLVEGAVSIETTSTCSATTTPDTSTQAEDIGTGATTEGPTKIVCSPGCTHCGSTRTVHGQSPEPGSTPTQLKSVMTCKEILDSPEWTEDTDNAHMVSFVRGEGPPIFKLDGHKVCRNLVCGSCYGCRTLSYGGKIEMRLFMYDMDNPEDWMDLDEDDTDKDPDYIQKHDKRPKSVLDNPNVDCRPRKKRRVVKTVFV